MGNKQPVARMDVPGYHGAGCIVGKDCRFRITDVQGCQIGDLFVLSATDPGEYLSPAWTRQVIFRLVPKPGDLIYSNRHRPLMRFLKDTSPGFHDMAFAPCDALFYELFGGGSGHPNCRDNFFAAMAALDIACATHPDPFNLFQNTVPDQNGEYKPAASVSRPGDFVEFLALMDLIVVLTACSVDISFDGVHPIGGESTPLRIEVFEPGPA